MPIDLSQFGPRRFLRPSREALEAIDYERFEVRPLSPTVGAEIHGLDLARPLADAAQEELRRALLDYKVLFFRDQDITAEQHVAFARRFGELELHPFLPSNTDFPELVRFSKDEAMVGVENQWHSDVTWRQEPSLGSVLRALEVPRVGGDTLFCDMEAAYLGLPDELRERIDGLVAVHDFTQTFGLGLDEKTLESKRREFPPAHHPVVRTHPETGRKSIYVNAIFTSHIQNLPREESDELLDLLCRQAKVPEYQCRFRWERNSLAFWDNRSVQHYAVSDYWPQRRVMERATIIGDKPV